MPYVYSHSVLSSEGRAAKSLQGVPVEERNRWVQIQTNTFKNWINEQLSKRQLKCEDLVEDLHDGVLLVQLVELLRNEHSHAKLYKNNPTEIQQLMNVQMALDALQEDGVKLVNIGSYDIVEGNIKLVLGLIWCLILRYQIASKTKIPPKKLMLSWIQAVLPELEVRNFSTNWNDGIALSALCNYCKPDICTNWRSLNKDQGLENCQQAIEAAREHLSVPMILSPEDLNSDQLDELSCMTYLSYFMKQHGAGYTATLNNVRRLVPQVTISNFKTDWNDGLVLSHLVANLGGRIPGWPHIKHEPAAWTKNLANAMNAARTLGVKPMIAPEEMGDSDVDQLAVMAYVAHLCNLLPSEPQNHLEQLCRVEPLEAKAHFVGQQVNIDITFLDDQIRMADVRCELGGQQEQGLGGQSQGAHATQQNMQRTVKGATLSFVPSTAANYQIRIFCLGQELDSSPVLVAVSDRAVSPAPVRLSPQPAVMPQSAILDEPVLTFAELTEPMAVGSLVEIAINASGRPDGIVAVTATSPNDNTIDCAIQRNASQFLATFTPNEIGEWLIGIRLNNEHIRGSPFSCKVFEPDMVQVYGLDVGVVGQELKFNVDAARAGHGDLKVSVLHHGRSIGTYVREESPGAYSVHFTPDGAGQYKIHIHYNTIEIKGSPFILDIVDASTVSVYGDQLRMASVGKLASFMINAVGADSKDISVAITAPSGKKKRAAIIALAENSYRVEWKAIEPGEHYVDVRLYSQSIQDSPFSCNVGDPDLVTVRNVPKDIEQNDLGDSQQFEIDATAAGSGNLEIMINGGRVACKVHELGSRHYLASFVPTQPITHVVEMRFNGEHVKGSPWRIEFSYPKTGPIGSGGIYQSSAVGSSQQAYLLAPIGTQSTMSYSPTPPPAPVPVPPHQQEVLRQQTTKHTESSIADSTSTLDTNRPAAYAEITGVGLQKACVGKVSAFEVLPGGAELRSEDIDVTITGANRVNVPVRVITSANGNLRCEFVTSDVGEYKLDLSIAKKAVKGSPFMVNSFAPQNVVIDPIPGGARGKPVQFFVDANSAGRGQLEISINQGKVPNSVEMRGQGKCLVTFIPHDVGTYVIDVTFNGELVKGCPVRVDVSDASHGSPQSIESGSLSLARQAVSPKDSTSVTRVNTTQMHTTTGYSSQTTSSQMQSTAGYQGAGHQSGGYQGGVSGYQQGNAASQETAITPEDEHVTVPYSAGHLRAQKRYEPSTTTTSSSHVQQRRSLSPDSSDNYMARFPYSRPLFDDQDKAAGKEHTTIVTEHTTTTTRMEPGLRRDFRDVRDGRDGSTTVAKYDYERSYDRSPEEKVPKTEGSALDVARATFTSTESNTQRDHNQEYQSKYYKDDQSTKTYSNQRDQRDDSQEPRRIATVNQSTSFDEARRVFEEGDKRQSKVAKQTEPIRSETREEYKTTTVTNTRTQDAPIQVPDEPKSPRSTSYSNWRQSVQQEKDNGKEASGNYEQHSYGQSSFDARGFTPTKVEHKRVVSTEQDKHIREPVTQSNNVYQTRSKSPPKDRRHSSSHSDVSGEEEIRMAKRDVPVEKKLKKAKKSLDEQLLQSVVVEGPGIGVIRHGQATEFVIAPRVCDHHDVHVNVMPPSKSHVPCEIEDLGDKEDAFLVRFTPTEVGTHRVHVQLQEQTWPHSPATVRVFDPDRIVVDGIHSTTFPQQIDFTVDASRAGYGNLEIAVRDASDEIVPSDVQQQSGATSKFLVTFTPDKPDLYQVFVSFNNQPVHGAPFSVHSVPPNPVETAIQASATNMGTSGQSVPSAHSTPSVEHSIEHTELTEQALTKTSRTVTESSTKQSATSPAHFQLKAPVDKSMAELVSAESFARLVVSAEVPADEVTAQVFTPNEQPVAVKVTPVEHDTFHIEFVPKMVGDHKVSVKFANLDVDGSPFTCRVYDARCIRVGDIPQGTIGKPVTFTVDASEAGVGNLEVAVNEGRIASMAHSLGQHRYEISFVPREPKATYSIAIRFNNDPVPGSPFQCKIGTATQVKASGPGLERVPVGQLTNISIYSDESMSEQPQVDILDPTGTKMDHSMSQTSKGNYTVEFTPAAVGSHQVIVFYGEGEISGSPFTCKAYDAQNVKLQSPLRTPIVGEQCSFYIDAAKAGAGNMEIIVSVDGRNVPNFVHAEGNAKFKVSFTPHEPQPHLVSVKFNREPVPGSPMEVGVNDVDFGGTLIQKRVESDQLTSSPINQVQTIQTSTASGDGLRQARVGDTSSFLLQDGVGECNVLVTDQSGQPIEHQMDESQTLVSFTPKQTGRVNVHVKDELLYEFNVVDPSQVFIDKWSTFTQMDKPFGFRVNSTDAGEGSVEVQVQHIASGRTSMCTLEKRPLTPGRWHLATFTPDQLGAYSIHVLFNGLPVTPLDQPLIVAAVVAGGDQDVHISGDGLRWAHVDQPSTFLISAVNIKEIAVRITEPNGTVLPCSIEACADQISYRISYRARMVGKHLIQVTVDDRLDSQPAFECSVYDRSAVRVLGLRPACVAETLNFTVDHGSAGSGHVEVAVTCDGQSVPHERSADSTQSLTLFSVTPSQVGTHKLNVLFNGLVLPECPYVFDVHDNDQVLIKGAGLSHAPINQLSSFTISPQRAGRGQVDAKITAADGDVVPVKCFQQKDGNLRFEYLPMSTGEHTITATFAEQPVAGSPFKVQVYDPSIVTLEPHNSNGFYAKQPAVVLVNASKAGVANVEAEVVDLNRDRVQTDISGPRPDGTYEVHFTPNHMGEFLVHVQYGGIPVANSPLSITAEDPDKPKAYGPGLEKAQINEKTTIYFDSKKGKGALRVEISGPASKTKYESKKSDEGVYEINYSPIETGLHQVNIYWKNNLLPGSPYPVPVVDVHQVHLVDGLNDRKQVPLQVGLEKVLTIDAKDAGPGEISAQVVDKNGRPVTVYGDHLGYGKWKLKMVPEIEGEHEIVLTIAGLAVPGPKLRGYANPRQQAIISKNTSKSSRRNVDESAPDHEKVLVSGDGLETAYVKKEAVFVIDASLVKAKGRPQATLMGRKADVPVTMTEMGNNTYRAAYNPQVPGNYKLEVLWNEMEVVDSPFNVQVAESAGASKILVQGDSLKFGIIGQEIHTLIDTRLAPPGRLACQCLGPGEAGQERTLCYSEIYDNRDGTYALIIKPKEIGKHELTIKYSDEHVQGSPYKIYVSMPPDPEKVRVYGPGVEHGILHRYRSNFVVETKGAGAGQLTVRIRGPKSAFNVDMNREKQNERSIQCKYEPREPGDYVIEVKWAGEHVPGSPFMVMIFDTEHELDRFLRGQPPSPPPMTPFLPPGWHGPPPGTMGGPPPMGMMGPYPPPHLMYGMGPPHHGSMGRGPMPLMPPPGPPPNGMPPAITYPDSTIQSRRSNKRQSIPNGY